MNLGGNYIIYENWHLKRLTIHQVDCPHVAAVEDERLSRHLLPSFSRHAFMLGV